VQPAARKNVTTIISGRTARNSQGVTEPERMLKCGLLEKQASRE
jgi:hypothetical protein